MTPEPQTINGIKYYPILSDDHAACDGCVTKPSNKVGTMCDKLFKGGNGCLTQDMDNAVHWEFGEAAMGKWVEWRLTK